MFSLCVSIVSTTIGPKTNMAMENPPFEAVFPIENGDFPASHVSFQRCIGPKTSDFSPKTGTHHPPYALVLVKMGVLQPLWLEIWGFPPF